jgi:hypothetical protein
MATTWRFIEEGRNHLIGDAPFDPGCPVRIIHGVRDDTAPFERSLRLIDLLENDDVHVTFVKDGDHRLSRPQDLALLFSTLEELCGGWEGGRPRPPTVSPPSHTSEFSTAAERSQSSPIERP